MLVSIFEDKKRTCVLLVAWMTMVWFVFMDLGITDAHFMNMGPSQTAHVMGVTLDSWYKWSCIAVFTFISTSINTFVDDAIAPWIQNTIQDHKTKYIPYPKYVCIIITQIWTLYVSVMSVFALFVMLSQIDFLLIRIFAELFVNTYTCYRFLKNKTHDVERYRAWMHPDDTANHAEDHQDSQDLLHEENLQAAKESK